MLLLLITVVVFRSVLVEKNASAVRCSTSLRRKGPTSRPSERALVTNGFFGGRGSSVLPAEIWTFKKKLENLKRKRLRKNEDSLLSCERFVWKLFLFHWPSMLRFLYCCFFQHEELFTRLRKIKMFVDSIVRISSNPRNSRIVNFQEAHDSWWTFLIFFGVWFLGPSPQCQSKQLQWMWVALDRWDSHDWFCKSRI